MQEIRIYGPAGEVHTPHRIGFRPPPEAHPAEGLAVHVSELETNLEQLYQAVSVLADRVGDLERPWYRRFWERLPWARRT